MRRKLTLGAMVLAIGMLSACDGDGHHPRWDRGGYGHDRDHRGDHDHDRGDYHGGYHDDNRWGPR